MLNQILTGAIASLLCFGIHAIVTGIIVLMTRHIAGRTDDLHVFMRISALLLVTTSVLTLAHVAEIALWAGAIGLVGVTLKDVGRFEYAFENYTALGYGDVIASDGWRLIGPIMALNGLLLIGWSVAVIFEVLKMAEVQIGRKPNRTR